MNLEFKINLPEEVVEILSTIEKNGHEAVVVGGAIRNQLINQIHNKNYPIKDYDIATNCDYSKLKDIFKDRNVKEVGAHFGVLMVDGYEIALYRTDGDYGDNRRPDQVEFVRDLKSDVKRRDFTMNGIAYSLKDGLIDHVCGIEDIRCQQICTIGDSDKRLQEDGLRIMRAIRFMCQYTFSIHSDLENAIEYNKGLISKISKERIRDELNKILLSKDPISAFDYDLIINMIIPELISCVDFDQKSIFHNSDVLSHLVEVLENTKPDLTTRLASLFHDIAKPKCFSVDECGNGHFYGHEKESSKMAEQIMKRLKYDNEIIKNVCVLIENHMNKGDKISDKSVKKFIRKVGEENLDRIFDLMRSDIISHTKPYNFEALDQLTKRCYRVIYNKEPIRESDLVINGNDIIKLGFKQGKIIGEILKELTDFIMEFPEYNNKEFLLKRVKENWI